MSSVAREMSPTEAAALSYAAKNWRVFPVAPKSKAPLIPEDQGGHGHLDATADTKRIRQWWAETPDANIGLVPGPTSIAIDVDLRAGGDKTLKELAARLGPLPPTVKSLTGGGGEHYFFGVPAGTVLPKQLGAGVDLKGCGTGYIVAPPSVHPNGTTYRWVSYCSPDEQKIADLPEPWLEEIRRSNGRKAAPAELPSEIYEGEGRNNALTSLAGTLRYRGMTEVEILQQIAIPNNSRCKPPLPDAELRRIAHSIGKKNLGPELQPQLEAPLTEWKEPTFYTLLDLERNPPPPVRFIVEPLLAEETLNLLFGKAFGGKSLFCLQLGLHAAAGLEFLGTFRFPRPLRCLYIDEEMGLPLLSARIEKMKSLRPEFRDPEVLNRFGFFSRAGLRLDDPKKLEFIRRKMGEFPGGPPDLGFMDTLRRMHLGEEKDSGEMAKLMDTSSSLVEEFGTTELPIHHSKKGPNDEGDWREAARGSGDLVAASQTVIALWKDARTLFNIRADVKAAGEIEPFAITLDPDTLLYSRQTDDDRIAALEASQDKAAEDAEPAVRKVLDRARARAAGKPYAMAKTTIAKAAGGKYQAACKAVERLLDQKVLITVPNPKARGELVCFAEDRENCSQNCSREGEK